MTFSSLDLHYLVDDLQAYLGAKVDRVYSPEKKIIFIQIHKTGIGKKFFKIIAGESFKVTDEKESTDTPSNFVMYLRKYLDQARIREIKQWNFERILEITFETKENKYHLILELFSKGNIVLTDEKYIIKNCLQQQKWQNRFIKPKEMYIFPPQKQNPFKDLKLLKENNPRQNIVKCLAIEYSFGGIYAEHICKESNIRKTKEQLDEEELRRVEKVIRQLKKVRPDILIEEKNELPKQHLEKKKKLEERSKKQLEHIQELEISIKEDQKKGDLVYENYLDVEKAIKSRKKILNLGFELTINPDKTVAQHAEKLYEKAKRAKRKIDQAKNSYNLTIQNLSNLELEQVKKPKRKREWYEKFHWFNSSTGFLVIGGKDSTSNDIIVKKHAEKGDLVFHTEEPGSPWFIIKSNNQEIDMQTIEETAQATASYSQAWKKPFQKAEVFYCKPEQIKKPKGLPAGSFIVEGDVKSVNVKLKLVIGKLDEQVIGGPLTAISKQTKDYFSIVQGKESKKDLAKKLSKKLKIENVDEIMPFIPSGKSKIKN